MTATDRVRPREVHSRAARSCAAARQVGHRCWASARCWAWKRSRRRTTRTRVARFRWRDVLTSPLQLLLLLLLLLLLGLAVRARAYDDSPYDSAQGLEVHTQPGDGKGGETLSVQPCIAFLDFDGRLVNTTASAQYDGEKLYARFLLSSLPDTARYAVLEQEGNEGVPSADIIDGWANFTGLKVDDLGVGFEINFYSNTLGLQTTSAHFDNVLGDPFELKVLLDVGTATGGEVFMPQPVVGVVDRGGNPIDWIQGATMTVSICEVAHGLGCTPNPGGTLFNNGASDSFQVDVSDGKAVFSGLAINVAGFPYQLRFETDYSGVAAQQITSANFTVGVGRAVEVRFEQGVDGARGGIPFVQQPIVSIRDAGGNVVMEDALAPPYSEVQLYLSNNPTVALLSSDLNATRVLGINEGIATALDFKVDKVGQGYQIRFTAIMRTVSGEEYSLFADSQPFDVTLGEPHALEIERGVGGAYAGGLPFYEQPIVKLVDGGGNVFEAESSATVTASLVVSSEGFPLYGDPEATFFRGLARFRSLRIIQMGRGYTLRFVSSVQGNDLQVDHTFDVLPSAEFEIMADDADRDDAFGHDLSIFDKTLLVGAPLEDWNVKEVQRVTTTLAENVQLRREVQRVRITGSHRVEIQELSSCGSGGPSTSLTGYMTLTFGSKTSRPFRYDIHPQVLGGYLEADIPEVGSLTVEKVINTACDTSNAFKWTIYFSSLEGEIPQLIPNFQGVSTVTSPDPDTFYFSGTEFPGMTSSSSATAVAVVVNTLMDSPTVAGTFRLLVGGDGTPLGSDVELIPTVDLDFDASEFEVKNAIETAVRSITGASHFQTVYDSFNLIDVSRSGPDEQRGYTWDITFPVDQAGVYDWRQLEANATGLSGLGVEISASTSLQGTAPLDGQFSLWFKGAGPSPMIDFDESELGMEAKLEALPTIDDVVVSRSVLGSGYVWTVTFIETRSKTNYGYVKDVSSNLPALKADVFELRGTDARVLIEYTFAVDDMDTLECRVPSDWQGYDPDTEPSSEACLLLDRDQFLLPNDMPVMGKMGHETGAAYVMYFDASTLRWKQGEKLRGHDSRPYDHFGWSVVLDNSTTAGGEQTAVVIIGAPHASYRGDPEVQSIQCHATSGKLAFSFRTQISPQVDFDVTAADLETALEATASITDVTVEYYLGSFDKSAKLAANDPQGLCQPSSSPTSAKVFASVTFVYPNNGDLPLLVAETNDLKIDTIPLLFDSSAPVGKNGHQYGVVEVTELVKGTILAKTTGEDGYNTGAAYVFLPTLPASGPESATNGWTQDAKLLPEDASAGDEFGFAVSAFLDTVVVGSPRHRFDADGNNPMGAAGALYVFTRDGQAGAVGVWTQTQKLTPPDRATDDRLGTVVLLKGNTIFASSPGKNNARGRVYIFKRQALGLPFTLDQAITPDEVQQGDNFGSAIATDENTLVVGADLADGPSEDESEHIRMAGAERATRFSQRASNGFGMKDCGVVYSFTRVSLRNTFVLHQIVRPRTPRSLGRFGHAVALERDLLLVNEQEDYRGPFNSRRYIYEVRTFLDGDVAVQGGQIGNLFALAMQRTVVPGAEVTVDVEMARFHAKPYVGEGERQRTLSDTFQDVQTAWLPYDVTAEEMQERVDRDLGMGDIIVTRSNADEFGGHTWTITFVDLVATGGKSGTLPKLRAINQLSGGGQIEVVATQTPLPYVHGATHLFKRKPSETGDWAEHAVLRPEVQQDGDLFGSAISLRGKYAAVGSPNRDTIDTSGINGGAAFIFNIGFANLGFQETVFSAAESAGSASISVSRCQPSCVVGFAPTPGPLPPGFGLDEVEEIQFVLVDGTARSRKDCQLDSRGSKECVWLDADDHSWNLAKIVRETFVQISSLIPDFVSPFRTGEYFSPEESGSFGSKVTSESLHSRYDFRAQSDYAPAGGQLKFNALEQSHAFEVVITNDELNEKPDETVNLLLFAAGMRPVPGGDYWATLTIEDDGDGGVGVQDTFDQIYAQTPATQARFGSASSMDGRIAAASAPFEPVGERDSAGAVYIYRQSGLGVWQLEQKLLSPNPQESGRFGHSLQVRSFPPHRVIVGAPGESPPRAYVFLRVSSDPAAADLTSVDGTWDLESTFALDASIVADPRCDPSNSGTQQRCRNSHHPINQDSFFAGENAVSLHNGFAAVGAKGLESVFVYRLKRPYAWYFFQLLKSSDYEDEVFPLNSEHAKVYVKRPLFGSSVVIYEDTLVVGATLEEHDRYEEPGRPSDLDVGLTCADAGFLTLAPTEPDLFQWKLNEYGNTYLWELATDDEKAAALSRSGAESFNSEVTCEETDPFVLTIKSTGIPNHPMGVFPLSEDTLFADSMDNPHTINVQEHEFRLARFPNLTKSNPMSVLQDPAALPDGPVGFALNGVPFFKPFDKHGDDTVSVHSIGYSGHLTDLCNGSPHEGIYGYRSNPVCLYPAPPQTAASIPQTKTGKHFPFVFDKDGVSNPDPGQRSPKLGYALDGFPIFGPFDENGSLPDDLDECNGRIDSQLGHYVYHITPWRAPYLIGCLRGKLSIETPPSSNSFPEFSPGSPRPRDLSFYGRGAAYVFMLRELDSLSEPLDGDVKGINTSPQDDPFDAIAALDAWVETAKLTPEDPERGDRFGQNLALENDQLLVSAHMDTAKARSTWDFETGDLRGWTKTGTAFDNQPTFGDNTAHRNVYGDTLISTFRDYEAKTYVGSSNRLGEKIDIAEYIEGSPRTVLYGPGSDHVDHPQSRTLPAHELREPMYGFVPGRGASVKHRGRFWIGSYENRPASFLDGEFVPSQPEGNAQGDDPQGTLLSDVFQIDGTKVSFLVGGGCDIDKVYVELLVDGVPVRRVTGKCEETMRRVVWDVSSYQWQSGMFRIVDLASARWGHINVDDFRFNWHASYKSRSTTPSSDGTDARSPAGGAMLYSGEPQAGAVYAFRRRSTAKPNEPCEIDCDVDGCFFINTPPNRTSCTWEQQQKLQPSDRRAFESFGWSMDIDDTTGIAVVGAVNGRLVDNLNFADTGPRNRVGAVYVFKREPERRSEFGTFEAKPFWYPTEHIKIQHNDKAESGHDRFGHSIGISGLSIVVGAPGRPAFAPIGEEHPSFNPGSTRLFGGGGSVYLVDVGAVHVRFAQKEYAVFENHQTLPSQHNRILIKVVRDGDLSRTQHVAYHTSDITATGVSEAKAAYCLGLDHAERGVKGCGDYVQQSGVLTFDPDDEEVEFELRTMNDQCNEAYSEFVGLQLSIPGGPPLIGEQFFARLRIDDDDQDQLVNKLFCPTPSKPVSSAHPFYSSASQPDLRGTPARVEATTADGH
ncbi:Putative glycosyl hydrolase ecdE [Durusdinium trenchii]|uniref:Glycosyl hydrolase ecdE n=1 Tax=Durusdinium trenchii TaxID=1381693 RepID=A0ABP0QTW5_9DINO